MLAVRVYRDIINQTVNNTVLSIDIMKVLLVSLHIIILWKSLLQFKSRKQEHLWPHFERASCSAWWRDCAWTWCLPCQQLLSCSGSEAQTFHPAAAAAQGYAPAELHVIQPALCDWCATSADLRAASDIWSDQASAKTSLHAACTTPPAIQNVPLQLWL